MKNTLSSAGQPAQELWEGLPLFDDDDFEAPVFKRLTLTDADKGRAHVSGPTLTAPIRDYFPKPPPPAPSKLSVEAILINDDENGIRVIHSGPATIQIQGRGKKATETYFSQIKPLREYCEKHDILVFQRSISRPGLFRITRVGTGSPNFSALTRLARGKEGVLGGSSLSKAQTKASTTGPAFVTEGSISSAAECRPSVLEGELNASFSVVGTWPDFQVTFESSDGHGRNSDYKRGVEVVLARLGTLFATLRTVRISSARVVQRATDIGLDPTFQPEEFPLPLHLNPSVDVNKLRRVLGRSGALVDSPAGTSGNTTRRMTWEIVLPGPWRDAASLARQLSDGVAPLAGAEGQVSAGTGSLSQTLTMVDDLAAIDRSFAEWFGALEAGSRPERGRHRWLATDAFMISARRSAKRPGAIDVQLGVRASGAPWTVEINAPEKAANGSGLASVGRSADGRVFLIRQGYLRPNPDSDRDIKDAEFRRLSGLDPIKVIGGATPKPRDWYIVAELGQPAETICSQTGAFVNGCARARLQFGSGLALPQSGPSLRAGDEKGGAFTKKAVDAQPEKEVLRLQGEVWLALSKILEAAELKLIKERHQAGYEVDGIILTEPKPILLEIKTGRSAADVYEGVGQLMIYAEMLKLNGYRRILLLSFDPSPALADAATACGIEVHSYQMEFSGAAPAVTFGTPFLTACGASPGL